MQDQEICRTCGSKLIQRETQRKASQLRQAYYYKAYYFCPKCQKIYHNDKFKVVNNLSAVLPLELLSPDTDSVDVKIWTDGACVFNGQHNAKAAWAFVSDGTERAGLVEGKQTNNVAEGLAIYHAVLWAAEKGFKKIKIFSDSQISINNMRKAVDQIKQNREIFAAISDLIKQYHLTVYFEKVIGHSGDINNERADKLANQKAGIK